MNISAVRNGTNLAVSVAVITPSTGILAAASSVTAYVYLIGTSGVSLVGDATELEEQTPSGWWFGLISIAGRSMSSLLVVIDAVVGANHMIAQMPLGSTIVGAPSIVATPGPVSDINK